MGIFKKTSKKSPAGINISDYSVEFLELDEKKKVKTYKRLLLEPGVVEDGKILEKEKFIQRLENLFEKVEASPAQVVASLPESRVFINYFEFEKKLEGKKLKEAIAEKAKKRVPLQFEKTCSDFITFSGEKNRVLYVAAPKKLVEDYVEIFNSLGVELTGLDLESVALSRNFGDENQAKMIVDAGHRKTNISCFTEAGNLALSVSSSIAGKELTETIQKELDFTEKEAKQLKKTEGLQTSRSSLKKVLQDKISDLASEIKRASTHFEKKFEQKLGPIYLTGGTSLLSGLKEELEKDLERPVKSFPENSGQDFLKDKREKLLFSVVYGLALGSFPSSESRINLLKAQFCDSENTKKRKFFSKKILRDSKICQKMNYHIPFPSSIATKLFAIPFFLLAVGLFGFVFYQYIFVGILSALPESTQDYVAPPRYERSLDEQGATTTTASSSLATSTKSETKTEPEIKNKVQILETGVGWLNARSGPGISYKLKERVEPGEEYLLLESQDDWYEIKLSSTNTAWISSKYATTAPSTVSTEDYSD